MITVQIVEVAARTGLWCDTCFLPSVVQRDIAVAGSDRAVATHTECGDCGWNPCR